MISIELLREVLKNDLCSYESIESVQGIDEIYENMLKYTTDENTSPLDGSYINTMREINIYELAFKCKEYGISEGWEFIIVERDGDIPLVEIQNLEKEDAYVSSNCDEDTNHKVFEVCQYIFEQKEIK